MHLLDEGSMTTHWCFLVAKAYETASLKGWYRNETDTLRVFMKSITQGSMKGTGLLLVVITIFLLVSLSPLFRMASAHDHKNRVKCVTNFSLVCC